MPAGVVEQHYGTKNALWLVHTQYAVICFFNGSDLQRLLFALPRQFVVKLLMQMRNTSDGPCIIFCAV